MGNSNQKLKLMALAMGSICGATCTGFFACAFKYTDSDIFLLLAGAGAVLTLILSAMFTDLLSHMESNRGDK
jgi:hypothetical protein